MYDDLNLGKYDSTKYFTAINGLFIMISIYY